MVQLYNDELTEIEVAALLKVAVTLVLLHDFFFKKKKKQFGGAKNNLFQEHDVTEVAVDNVGTYSKENQR